MARFFYSDSRSICSVIGSHFRKCLYKSEQNFSHPGLPSRALISLMLLLTILIYSLLLLVPSESLDSIAIEILLVGLISWTAISKVDYDIFKTKEKQYRNVYLLHMSLNQVAILPYFVCGFYLFNGNASGLYWLVASVIFSFLKASLDAWVLLIEINR